MPLRWEPHLLKLQPWRDDIEVVPEREGSFGWGRQVKGYHVGDFIYG